MTGESGGGSKRGSCSGKAGSSATSLLPWLPLRKALAVGSPLPAKAALTPCGLGPRQVVRQHSRLLRQAATPLEILLQVKEQEPVAPHRLTPGVPLDLEAGCLRCLEKDPARRYGSAAELAADLGRFLRGEATTARPEGAWGRRRRWVRRNWVVAGLLTAVAVVLLLGSVVSSFFGLVALRRAEEARTAQKTAEEQQREAETARGQALQGEQKAEQEKKKAEEARAQAEAEKQHANFEKQIAEQEKQNAEAARGQALHEKQKAEEARGQAEADKQRANEQFKRANDQLTRTELALYAGQLANAQREWQDGNGGRALEILDSCQWNLRSLEFRHLWTRYNSNQQTLRGHTGSVTCVAISPDGKRIVSGSWDNTLKVWDADKGQEILTLRGHTAPVLCVAIGPDSKRIVSSSGEGTLKVWDADIHPGLRALP